MYWIEPPNGYSICIHTSFGGYAESSAWVAKPRMRGVSRSVSVGAGAEIFAARSSCDLWQRLRRDDEGHRNGGGADRAASSMAESLRGTARGLHPERMPRPRHRVESEIVTPDSAKLFCLL